MRPGPRWRDEDNGEGGKKSDGINVKVDTYCEKYNLTFYGHCAD